MTALNPLLAKVFRGPLDLNGPVLGRIFYLFEYARSYIEERFEAFDARFGTDTSAPVFERGQKTSVHFYVPTTASVIYKILRSIPLQPNKFAFVDMGSGKGRALLVASEFPFTKIVGIEFSEGLHRIAQTQMAALEPIRSLRGISEPWATNVGQLQTVNTDAASKIGLDSSDA